VLPVPENSRTRRAIIATGLPAQTVRLVRKGINYVNHHDLF